MPATDRILIANRGEIALRIIRSARRMGIATVAVYSDADARSPHALAADRAVHIGPAPVGQSYLNAARILQAAADTGADSIHPGYGFLSENADFAAAAVKAGLNFIGPSAQAIARMGDKAKAKRRMMAAGVPCIPGYDDEDQSDSLLLAEGGRIGFPLMVKAAAGGGGRGMRLVRSQAELADAIATGRAEAQHAFGDGSLILERALLGAKHVEVQVLADSHGNTVHLGERDCSVQRRHQKVIEEAPCPVVNDKMRRQMGETAVQAARSIDYCGAGTVEFLLDPNGHFYFLEMNTRLQVEHPVTEQITGLDLVEWQIRIAQGASLPFAQKDIAFDGHAVEARLYAEDPDAGFVPCTGKIALWQPAEQSAGLRYDAGIATGQHITPFYDPMLAKVIASGPSRDIAVSRLIAGLRQTALFGPKNNRDFLIRCLQAQAFADGQFTTEFIEQTFADGASGEPAPSPTDWACLAALFYHHQRQQLAELALLLPAELENFTTAPGIGTPFRLQAGGGELSLHICGRGPGLCEVTAAGENSLPVRCRPLPDHQFELQLAGHTVRALSLLSEDMLHASLEGRYFRCVNVLGQASDGEQAAGSGQIASPMHGRITELSVKVGDKVRRGQRLAVLEAMKMQHDIASDVDGIVRQVAVSAGQQISADDLMIGIETE